MALLVLCRDAAIRLLLGANRLVIDGLNPAR